MEWAERVLELSILLFPLVEEGEEVGLFPNCTWGREQSNPRGG